MAAKGPLSRRETLAAIAARDVGIARWDEPLSAHCTWRIGGPADLLVEPESVGQVALLVRAVADAGLPLVVMGKGSNLLFSDRGVRGVVLKIGDRMSGFTASGRRVVAGAGITMPWFARKSARAGISGFEHTVGIPGTLGGLVLMNGGSQRKSIGGNVARIWGVSRQGEPVCVEHGECDFGYRRCAPPYPGMIVTGVELAGGSGEPGALRREMIAILRERRGKFPLKQPNCGSVFLSTPELHAAFGPPGRVIEEAGLKGLSLGGAQVSLKHANFIVNRGEARACEVLGLIGEIRKQVAARYGVDLRCEVRYIDQLGRTRPADELCCGAGEGAA